VTRNKSRDKPTTSNAAALRRRETSTSSITRSNSDISNVKARNTGPLKKTVSSINKQKSKENKQQTRSKKSEESRQSMNKILRSKSRTIENSQKKSQIDESFSQKTKIVPVDTPNFEAGASPNRSFQTG
jgi:hypothetical protein